MQGTEFGAFIQGSVNVLGVLPASTAGRQNVLGKGGTLEQANDGSNSAPVGHVAISGEASSAIQNCSRPRIGDGDGVNAGVRDGDGEGDRDKAATGVAGNVGAGEGDGLGDEEDVVPGVGSHASPSPSLSLSF